MLRTELVRQLNELVIREGDAQVDLFDLVELVRGRAARREWLARQKIILQIIRAKRDAGFPPKAVFFTHVWPEALAALTAQRDVLRWYHEVMEKGFVSVEEAQRELGSLPVRLRPPVRNPP